MQSLLFSVVLCDSCMSAVFWYVVPFCILTCHCTIGNRGNGMVRCLPSRGGSSRGAEGAPAPLLVDLVCTLIGPLAKHKSVAFAILAIRNMERWKKLCMPTKDFSSLNMESSGSQMMKAAAPTRLRGWIIPMQTRLSTTGTTTLGEMWYWYSISWLC